MVSFDFAFIDDLFMLRKRQLSETAMRLRAAETRRRRRRVTDLRRAARLQRESTPVHPMVLRSHLSRVVNNAGVPGSLAPSVRDALSSVYGLCQCAECGNVATPDYFLVRHRCIDCTMASYTRDPQQWFAEHLAKEAAVRAQRVGIACDIDADWVSAAFAACANRCALCNGEMHIERRRRPDAALPVGGTPFVTFPLNASLDQREPRGGYTRTNVQLVHLRCNLAKLDMPQADFIALCKAVASCHGSTTMVV